MPMEKLSHVSVILPTAVDYIRRIAASGNVETIWVKLADNEDNSDPGRDHSAASRLLEQKYRPARRVLGRRCEPPPRLNVPAFRLWLFWFQWLLW